MNDPNRTPPVAKNIPIPDMTPLYPGAGNKDLAREVNEVCKLTAVFYVTNHGVSRQPFDASRLFFKQPVEVHMRALKDKFH